VALLAFSAAAAAALGVFLLTAAPETWAAEVKALRIRQVVSGMPGARPGESTRSAYQELTVDLEGDRLALKEYKERNAPQGNAPGILENHYILRLDEKPAVIYDVFRDADGLKYREHHGDLSKSQEKRRYHELEIVNYVKRLPVKERQKILEENHLKPDGSREVTVKTGETQDILGHRCRRQTITENGRAIIDVFLADKVAGGRSFLHLYRKLGVFSDEVLEKVSALRGLPLKGTITVVTELPTYRLSLEVKKIDEVTVSDAVFRPPAGAEKVADKPKEVRCAQCGKVLEPEESGGRYRDQRGVLYYFCTEEEMVEWLKDR
jgi:hypothetical protein